MVAAQDGAEDIESRPPAPSLSYVNAAPQLGTLREEVAESASAAPQLPGIGAARSVVPLPELPPPHLASLLTVLLASSVFLHESLPLRNWPELVASSRFSIQQSNLGKSLALVLL